MFANVDLDVYSKSKLDPLIDALREKVSVLYLGREGHRYSAHLELATITKDPDRTIRDLAALIRNLPRSTRKHWDKATTRDFNIGLNAPAKGELYIGTIKAETVKLISSLNARILVTVYGPQPPGVANKRQSPSPKGARKT